MAFDKMIWLKHGFKAYAFCVFLRSGIVRDNDRDGEGPVLTHIFGRVVIRHTLLNKDISDMIHPFQLARIMLDFHNLIVVKGCFFERLLF